MYSDDKLLNQSALSGVLRDAIEASPSLLLVLATFGGVAAIPFVDAVRFAGFAPQTARNLLSDNIFPIRSYLQNGRRFIHSLELAKYMDESLSVENKSTIEPPTLQEEASTRRRGRPTKALVLARRKNMARE